METPPDLQVYDLGHLGLVASILDQIGLVQTVDRFVGPRPGEKVSTGMALKAASKLALIRRRHKYARGPLEEGCWFPLS
ncbi:hypothetical protein TthSNM76_21160 (plasmid) [Thermus thermophilus]|nr:hypothetical protein TthSNM76_21160 [Thermus thermophilus]